MLGSDKNFFESGENQPAVTTPDSDSCLSQQQTSCAPGSALADHFLSVSIEFC